MSDPWSDPDFVRDEREANPPEAETPPVTEPDHDPDATVESEWNR